MGGLRLTIPRVLTRGSSGHQVLNTTVKWYVSLSVLSGFEICLVWILITHLLESPDMVPFSRFLSGFYRHDWDIYSAFGEIICPAPRLKKEISFAGYRLINQLF